MNISEALKHPIPMPSKAVYHRKFIFLNSTFIAAAAFLTVIAGFAILAFYTKLAVYASILAIGMALALQKYVSSYFGFFIVRFSNIFNIGDRIRMGNIKGDVKHIGLFHFVLEEVGEYEKLGGELTGRILHIPNLVVLDQPVLNYSKSYSAGDKLVSCDYIFDEVRIPLTLKSDVDEAAKLFEAILKNADQTIIGESKEAFRNDYPEFLREAEEGPRILVHLEPQRIWLKGKLVVPVRTRNQLKSEVLSEFLRQIRTRENIQVA